MVFVRLLAVCVALALGAGLAGCGGRQDDATRSQILQKGNGAEPETLDPHLMSGHPEFYIAWALFEGLTTPDPVTLEPRPGMAESWEVSPDGLLYRFHLRSDAKWSTGEPLTARDFLFSWKRALSPALGSSYANLLYCIANAEAYNSGTLEDFSQVGISAPEERVFEVRLGRPTPQFLAMLCLPVFLPVHEASIAEHGPVDQREVAWTRPGHLVTNGPFQLTDWRPNDVLRVRRNPYYWDTARVRLEGIDFRPIQSLQTEERAFRTGRLHLTYNVSPGKIAVYQRKHPELLYITPFYGTYFYRFNTTRPPLNDPRVRRALALALDRRDLVENVARGGQLPADSLVPPGVGYEPTARLACDPEEARRLLAEAGYPNGQGFPALSLLYNTDEAHRALAQAAQHLWKSNLGIEITLQNQDWKVYLNTVKQLDYDIARGSWIADYADPANLLETFQTGNGNNRAGYSNAEYDALLTQAQNEPDPGKRMGILQKAEALLLTEPPFAPVYHYTNIYLKVPELKGFTPNILGMIPYKSLYFEKDGEKKRNDPPEKMR